MRFLKFIWNKLTARRPLKPYLLNEKHRVIPAFTWAGEDYYCFDSAYEMPTARAWAASTFYTELEMRVDKDYLSKHIRACEILLSGKKNVDLGALAIINNNLKERLALAPFPDHIYKLASVSFFTKDESPYSYDPVYNEKKMNKWKEAPGTLDFFLKGPLQDLLPYLPRPEVLSPAYFMTQENVNNLHLNDLHSVISSNGPLNGMKV